MKNSEVFFISIGYLKPCTFIISTPHPTFPPLPSRLHVVCAAMRWRTRDVLLKVGYIRGYTLKNGFFSPSSSLAAETQQESKGRH